MKIFKMCINIVMDFLGFNPIDNENTKESAGIILFLLILVITVIFIFGQFCEKVNLKNNTEKYNSKYDSSDNSNQDEDSYESKPEPSKYPHNSYQSSKPSDISVLLGNWQSDYKGTKVYYKITPTEIIISDEEISLVVCWHVTIDEYSKQFIINSGYTTLGDKVRSAKPEKYFWDYSIIDNNQIYLKGNKLYR